MTKAPKQSAIQNEVMKQIHSGSVRMKPRVYFTMLWALGIVAWGAASVTFAYIISMLFYIVRIQTASTPAYGARHNLSDAIASFPWWAVVVTIVLSVIAIWLMRTYGRVYRYRISSVVVVFILSSLLLGIVLSSANIGHKPEKNTTQNKPNGMHLQDGTGRGFKSNNY